MTPPYDNYSLPYHIALRTCAVDVFLIDKVLREQGTWWSVIFVAGRLNSECIWNRRRGGGWGFTGMGGRVRVDVYYNFGQGGNGTLGGDE